MEQILNVTNKFKTSDKTELKDMKRLKKYCENWKPMNINEDD